MSRFWSPEVCEAFRSRTSTAMQLAVAFCLLVFHVMVSSPESILEDVASDPDALRNVSELISSKGYPVQDYDVVTSDGYVLGIQRIPHGKDKSVRYGRKKVVFLLHGLLTASSDWVLNFAKQSLGFILADAGYDVWLGNVRGNTYSRHVRYTKNDKEFWNFSFDEMIAFDLPAMTDFVLKMTGEDQLYYVGHSQGTLVMFGLLAERPEYNRKIKMFAPLAPAYTIIRAPSPIRLLGPFAKDIATALALLGDYEFLPNNKFVKLLANTACKYPVSRLVCESAIFLIAGIDSKQLNETRLPVYLSHDPAGTSTKNLVHYAQLSREPKCRKYDYGLSRNEQLYGQPHPPIYNISRITVPVALLWSRNDWLADPADVATIRDLLPNVVLNFEVADRFFTHFDFIFGLHANELVYAKVLELLDAY